MDFEQIFDAQLETQFDTPRVSTDILTIQNQDGSPRWIWPTTLTDPSFLLFYNASTLRAKFFVWSIKAIFLLRCQTLLFKKTQLQVPVSFGTKWSMFAGTIGINQKCIIHSEGQLIKIPIGIKANESLKNEKMVLSHMNTQPFNAILLPTTDPKSTYTYVQSVYQGPKTRSNTLTKTHLMALKEIAETNIKDQALSQNHVFKALHDRILHIKNNTFIPKGIINKLEDQLQRISPNDIIRFTYSHGDFTPWNMYVHQDNIFLYDWESGGQMLPYGYDAFHFIIQQGVLVDRQSWTTIYSKINKDILQPAYPFFQSQTQMDAYLTLYLVFHITKTLEEYASQRLWHDQIYWLIDTWNDALDHFKPPMQTQRDAFLDSFFDFLHHMPYAGIKIPNIEPRLLEQDSDIDILVLKTHFDTVLQWCEQKSLGQYIKVSNTSYMSKWSIYFTDGSFVHLDLIKTLKRKALTYLNTDLILENRVMNSYGVASCSDVDTARYLACFYGLNNANIPPKYSHFGKALRESKTPFDTACAMQFSQPSPNELRKEIENFPENKGISKIVNQLLYIIDTCRSFFKMDGLIVTFSGVDGAGKSTIINEIKHKIEKSLRKEVIVLRHRPSILPIISALKHGKAKAEEISISKLPRTGQNKNSISSLLRFGYYFTDFLFGQFYIYVKYVCRGKVVLYDRYYFDFINDGRRSNIHLPEAFIKFGYRFLLKPDLNYFLYADADIILQRKQELDKTTIKELTGKYLSLFAGLASKYYRSQYIPINNERKETTLSAIFLDIKTASHNTIKAI